MDLSVGRRDGRYERIMNSLMRSDLLILDDFGLSKLNDVERQDLLEVMEDRYEVRSTAIIGQLPVDKWHEIVGDSTVADAILDRVVHNSFSGLNAVLKEDFGGVFILQAKSASNSPKLGKTIK